MSRLYIAAVVYGALAEGYTYRHIVHQVSFGPHRYGDVIPPPNSEQIYSAGRNKAHYGAHRFEHQILHRGVPVAKLRYDMHPDEPGVIQIHGLAAHPDHRGAGLPEHLGDKMQEHAEAIGAKIDHGNYTDQGFAFRKRYEKRPEFKPELHLPYPDRASATTGGEFLPHMLDPHEIEQGRKQGAYSWQAEYGWDHHYANAAPGWEHDDHDDALEHRDNTGSYHPSLGRTLLSPRAAWRHRHASAVPEPLPDHEQEERLAPGRFKTQSPPQAPPSDHIVTGARDYCARRGMADPHDIDYSQVHTTADNTRAIGRAFHAMPEHDERAIPHFESMRQEIHQQFHHMTHNMGIKAEFVDHDPYTNSKDMMHDVHNNKRIKVLKTDVTGPHPYFSNEENDKFRAVHDVFGHAATGRGFDKHGEEAAFTAHSKMFSSHARKAMATETRGQNHFYNLNGRFAQQKLALLPDEHHGNQWTGQP